MRTCRSASSGRGHKALTECVAKAPHAVQLRREGLTVQALFEAALSEEEKPNRCHQMVAVSACPPSSPSSSPPAGPAKNVTTQSSGSPPSHIALRRAGEKRRAVGDGSDHVQDQAADPRAD